MKAQVASWAGSLEPYGFKLETPNFKSKCSSGQCAPDSVPMALFGCKNDQSDEKRFQVRTKGRETQGWHQPSAAWPTTKWKHRRKKKERANGGRGLPPSEDGAPYLSVVVSSLPRSWFGNSSTLAP